MYGPSYPSLLSPSMPMLVGSFCLSEIWGEQKRAQKKSDALSLREELLPEGEEAQPLAGRERQPFHVHHQAGIVPLVPDLLELDGPAGPELELVQGVQEL